ncbi:uncharacterized protein K452DRAFT_288955 [Aplosporella prunicola CBS 121167]|uniref:Anaphase-promoting complex subunit 4 WD40 domain-containing protein n=1 Tax=Aplosporella prunicola CBS 121167 TaxID=1176127 RepID=A0A6A6B7S3_9PEZI|nr:uncharacterized protein K452DRAFT_288955 [Aplosporella prunicola CBS 121167]KAF2140189.1 hypothetical protein K452DRAFT_288955 [Aplosporella prunicola CBS 121167]
MRTATPLTASNLSLPPDSYIYALSPAGSSALAALSSDDSVRWFDPASLQLLPDGVVKNAHRSVTCLKAWDEHVLATAGRDGAVRLWDRRTEGAVGGVSVPKNLPLSALTTHAPTHRLIAGTEYPNNPPGDAPIFIYDTRQLTSNPTPALTPLLTLPESHTDTITELTLHPSRPSTLLSGSTDGLACVFDISQPDEDEALRRVLNHAGAVHRAAWVGERDVGVFSTDEALAFYEALDEEGVEGKSGQEGEEDGPKPVRIGDVRELLGCEYVVGVGAKEGVRVVAAGNHSNQHLDLLPLHPPTQGATPLAYACSQADCLRLPGAHGEEIVRDFYFAPNSTTLYTCGEDGHVRAWSGAGADDVFGTIGHRDADEDMRDDGEEDGGAKKAKKEKSAKGKGREKRKERKEKKKDRFAPY